MSTGLLSFLILGELKVVEEAMGLVAKEGGVGRAEGGQGRDGRTEGRER